MLSQEAYFRQQAQRCRELAELISRADFRARMLALADEHARIAADLEKTSTARG